MKAFARLYAELDEARAAGEKVAALGRYFTSASPGDAAWAVHFLTGRRPTLLLGAATLRAWAVAAAGVPDWLFDHCYDAVGDLSETIALLFPDPPGPADLPLAYWVEERLLALPGFPPDTQRAMMLEAWRTLGSRERVVWNRLVTGRLRVSASRHLLVRALSEVSGVPEGAVAHRLMGTWEPTPESFARLIGADVSDTDVSRPYPFCLAHPLEDEPTSLGDPADWLAEWMWDGIRVQLVRREGRAWIWTFGDELITERFPEVAAAATVLPEGTVLDGELLAWRDDRPLPVAQLERRTGRAALGPKLLAEAPVSLVAFDLLEHGGTDLRPLPLRARRERLAAALRRVPESILLSPAIDIRSWEAVHVARAGARTRGAGGLLLKRLASAYGAGRRPGDWWKWKVPPLTVHAVLISAEPGQGSRAGLFTDYTLGVWAGDRLVPIARARSGLTENETRRVDAFVRRHTIDRFGPVRTVKPELVFELAFEGIQPSSRHKSGIAMHMPCVTRWRTDKRSDEADTLEAVRRLVDTRDR